MTSLECHGVAQRPVGMEALPKNLSPDQAERTAAETPEFNMLYGDPAEQIAEWCCVVLTTAFAYRPDRPKPGKPAARLFRLRGRMLLTPQWRGCLVPQNAIVDADRNETPRGLLRNHYLTLHDCRERVRSTGDERAMDRWRTVLEAA